MVKVGGGGHILKSLPVLLSSIILLFESLFYKCIGMISLGVNAV